MSICHARIHTVRITFQPYWLNFSLKKTPQSVTSFKCHPCCNGMLIHIMLSVCTRIYPGWHQYIWFRDVAYALKSEIRVRAHFHVTRCPSGTFTTLNSWTVKKCFVLTSDQVQSQCSHYKKEQFILLRDPLNTLQSTLQLPRKMENPEGKQEVKAILMSQLGLPIVNEHSQFLTFDRFIFEPMSKDH